MELDDLKEAWAALDNRLKKNEELNESIILEMMKSKAGKKVNWFIIYEMFSAALLLFLVPFCIYYFDLHKGKLPIRDTSMLFMAVVFFMGTFWTVYKLHGLMKFDITKNVGDNVLCMNRYNIQLKKEIKIIAYFLGPVFVIFGVWVYAAGKATLPLWTFLTCAFIFAVLFCYWFNKKYNRSIESVVKSLDEIRELREE